MAHSATLLWNEFASTPEESSPAGVLSIDKATPGARFKTAPLRDRDRKQHLILMADDDPDDRLLTKEALSLQSPGVDVRFVEDGAELLDYLLRRGAFADGTHCPRPHLILLDLNMPRVSGLEALGLIKATPELRRIPILIMTTSNSPDSVLQSYDTGANSYITKPVGFAELSQLMRHVCEYWLDSVELPD